MKYRRKPVEVEAEPSDARSFTGVTVAGFFVRKRTASGMWETRWMDALAFERDYEPVPEPPAERCTKPVERTIGCERYAFECGRSLPCTSFDHSVWEEAPSSPPSEPAPKTCRAQVCTYDECRHPCGRLVVGEGELCEACKQGRE